MSHPEPALQQKRMDAIRNRVALATPDWGIESDGGRLCLTAASSEGNFLIATIAADAPIVDSEMVLNAPYDLIWLLGTYDALAGRYRTLVAELRSHAPPQHSRSRRTTRPNARSNAPSRHSRNSSRSAAAWRGPSPTIALRQRSARS